MKKIKGFLSLATLLMFFVTLFSCIKNSQNTSRIEFDSIVVKQQVPLLEKKDSTLPYADISINFVYPKKFGNDKDKLVRLQQIFLGTFLNDKESDKATPKEAIDEYLKSYIYDYKELSNDFYIEKAKLPKGEIPMWYWYYISLVNKVVYQSDFMLSTMIDYSDYTGGAHGSQMRTYINIDLSELTTITENDLFVDNYSPILTKIIIDKLLKDNNLKNPSDLLEMGFFDLEEISPNSNFYLSDKGMHYVFNQYEIAPYVMGIIEVDIPYEAVLDILKPDSIIKKFMNKK